MCHAWMKWRREPTLAFAVACLSLCCSSVTALHTALRQEPSEAALPPLDRSVAGGLHWPYLREGDPDVFVHFAPTLVWNKKEFEQWVYAPASFTIGSAFSKLGANVAYTDDRHVSALSHYVERGVQAGRRPVIVAVALGLSEMTSNETRLSLQRCAELGAFIVLLQTEIFVFTEAHFSSVHEMAKLYHVAEVWDFSLANLEYVRQHNSDLRWRYLPPGYVEEFDLNVDTSSRLRNISKVGFMGRWKVRDPALKVSYHNQLGASGIAGTSKIRDLDHLRWFATIYPVQLTMHRAQNCCPSTNAVEAFRMAQLLPNKACVISARCYPPDEAKWEGILHFATVEETGAVFEGIKKDVPGCQEKSYETYKARFDPLRLLQESGFVSEVWEHWPHG